MDAVYQKAIAKREALKREIAEVDMFLKLYERYANETEQKQSEPFLAMRSGSPQRHKRKVRPSELVDIIERLIRSRETPMQRGEIVDALSDGDIELESQDPARYLGTILWRNSNRFINIPGEGYAIPELLTETQKMKVAEAKSGTDGLSEDAVSEIRDIAKNAAETIRGDESQRVIQFGITGTLPPEVDGRILAIARDTLGRKLDEQEKRTLREEFRKAY